MYLLDLVCMICLFVCHIAMLMLITEQRYSIKKSLTIWGVTLVWSVIITVISLHLFIWKTGYAVAFTLTILLHISIYFYLSSDSFAKALFLFITYANLFLVLQSISGLLAATFFENIRWATPLIRSILYIPVFFGYLRYLRRIFGDISANIQKGWWPLNIVSFLFLLLLINSVIYPHPFYEYTVADHISLPTVFIFIAAMYYVIFHTIHYMNKAAEMMRMELRSEYLAARVEEMQESVEYSRRVRHDQRHHNLIIAEYVKKGKTDELLCYLDQQEQEAVEYLLVEICEHSAANNILLAYARKAEQNHIPIHFEVALEKEIAIKDVDLVAILANIMENAIYGCIHSHAQKQEISMYIKRKANKLVIECRNTCDMSVSFKSGLPRCKSGSGIGIPSILHATRKYAGEANFNKHEGMFICQILLNIHPINK